LHGHGLQHSYTNQAYQLVSGVFIAISSRALPFWLGVKMGFDGAEVDVLRQTLGEASILP